MRKFYAFLTLLAFIVIVPRGLQAQQVSTSVGHAPRPVRFGINSGVAWQQSDVKCLPGAGLGLTLDIPLIENDHTVLGLGLRPRWLWTATYGQDWKQSSGILYNDAVNGNIDPNSNYLTSPGYTYLNHRTRTHELSLELVLRANRLRAQTGVLFYLFGGMGLDSYKVNVDQLDGSYTKYDWTQITATDKFNVRNQVNDLRDHKWETFADNRRPHWVFAPAVGVGFGYEFHPAFSIAVEHKVTFPNTDRFDGQEWKSDNTYTRYKDIYHYTSFGLYLGIYGGHGGGTYYNNNNVDTYTVHGSAPVVQMVFPNTPDYNMINDCSGQVQAYVTGVSDASMIEFRHNGRVLPNTWWTYDPSSHVFNSWVSLYPGVNTFNLISRNAFGTTDHAFTMTCSLQGPPPPVVIITYPDWSPFETGPDCRGHIEAEVYNVPSAASIMFYQNDMLVNRGAWTYNPATKLLVADVMLTGGVNTFTITASNAVGTATRSTQLICPVVNGVPPVVNITTPGTSPFVSTNCNQNIVATVLNVANKNWITVMVDGLRLDPAQFTWSPSTGVLSMNMTMASGSMHTVEITATNEFGVARDYQTLSCSQALPPPIIYIINPAGGVYLGTDCHQTIRAEIRNVTAKKDIAVYQGATPVPLNKYFFDPTSRILTMDVDMVSGNNYNYSIIASNNSGTATEYVSLRCSTNVPTITICHFPPGDPDHPVTITIAENQWGPHQAHGDYRGPCSTNQITICHHPPGDPANPITLTINESAWPAHQAHGDTRGVCPPKEDPMITICHHPGGGASKTVTMEIPESQWSYHAAHGDTKGACPVIEDPQIVICHHPPGNPTNTVELTIPESAWPAHQSHGDTKGPCPAADPNIVICHHPPGNPTNTNELTIPESAWPAHQAHGDTKGPCPPKEDPQITICHRPPGKSDKPTTITINESAWPTHQAHGDTKGACPAEDPQIVICHHPPGNPTNTQELTIPESAWPAHQAHGDTKGPCPAADPQITICHRPPGKPENATTITIAESAWPAHAAHGDTKGACPAADPQITICHHPPGKSDKPTTITIAESAWATHHAHGDTRGACPAVDPQIVICHHPPGNPTNTQELTIPESAWAAHAAHGDTRGPCPAEDPQITICHHPPGNPTNTQELTIPESAWSAHAAHGDTRGPCPEPEEQIAICHHPPGNPTNTQDLTIPESAWPAHAAHGDTKGPCPEDPQIVICHHSNAMDPHTITIAESAWPAHQAHGDTRGECPPVEEDPSITICHHPPGNPTNTQEITINESAWPAHAAHGDTKGNCPAPDPQITICHHPPGNPTNTQELTIPESAWAAHAAHGDSRGPCPARAPDPDITICHHPPGNPTNTQELTIPESAWAAHAAHGDTRGPCPARGSDPEIVICHHPPGNPTNTQELTIPESAWSAHAAHGDTRGPCSGGKVGTPGKPGGGVTPAGGSKPPGGSVTPAGGAKPASGGGVTTPAGGAKPGGVAAPAGKTMVICHTPPATPAAKPSTLTIPIAEWVSHQKHGDTAGACK